MLGTRSSLRPDARPNRPWSSKGGFTLVELVAALALSGLVAAGAWGLVSQLGDAEEGVRLDRAMFAARVNGERLARSVIAHAEADPLPDGRFAGNSAGASFRSWCLTPAGWLERCRVAFAVVSSWDSSSVVLRAGPDDVVVVRRPRPARLLYYDALRPAEPWSTVWSFDAALPHAVGIAFGADTLVFPTGVR